MCLFGIRIRILVRLGIGGNFRLEGAFFLPFRVLVETGRGRRLGRKFGLRVESLLLGLNRGELLLSDLRFLVANHVGAGFAASSLVLAHVSPRLLDGEGF